jgi:hypothetical protein
MIYVVIGNARILAYRKYAPVLRFPPPSISCLRPSLLKPIKRKPSSRCGEQGLSVSTEYLEKQHRSPPDERLTAN